MKPAEIFVPCVRRLHGENVLCTFQLLLSLFFSQTPPPPQKKKHSGERSHNMVMSTFVVDFPPKNVILIFVSWCYRTPVEDLSRTCQGPVKIGGVCHFIIWFTVGFFPTVLYCVLCTSDSFGHTCDPTVESNRLAQSKESREKGKEKRKKKKVGYRAPAALPVPYPPMMYVCIFHLILTMFAGVYCVLCTVYCVLCTVYCVLCTVYCVLCTVYCVLCTVYCVLCTVYCVLCTVYCVLCTVYCVLCTVYCCARILSCVRLLLASVTTQSKCSFVTESYVASLLM